MLNVIDQFCKNLGVATHEVYPNFRLPIQVESDHTNRYSNTLKLKNDQSHLSESEILNQIENFDSLKSLVQNEDIENSLFNWSPALHQIPFILSFNNISELSTIYMGRKGSDFYAKLSDLALKIDNNELALTLANKSLSMSGENGWIKQYDGGTRITAFNAMKNIDSLSSTEKAIEIFSQDILTGNYPSIYIECLDDIIPLITTNFEKEEIWNEISSYLQRLMSNSNPKTNIPEIIKVDRPIIESLIDYLFYLAKYPISIISESSIKLITSLIDKGEKYALTKLLNTNIQSYADLAILDAVIMHLLALGSAKLEDLKPVLNVLSISKDHLIRNDACKVLLFLGENIPKIERLTLPNLYSLHLDEISRKSDRDPALITVNNPRDLISPFDNLITQLSKLSKVKEITLIYRIHAILKEIEDADHLTTEFETDLRNRLNEIRLNFPYKIPRVSSVRRAIMHLITELSDSELIDKSTISKFVPASDFTTSYFKIIPKPHFIQTIGERESGSVGGDWLNRINDSERLGEKLITYEKGMSIIGENSIIRNLFWGTPTEFYKTQLSYNIENHANKYSFFDIYQIEYQDYHNINLDESNIIIRNQQFNNFDMKGQWLAINPSIAKILQWEKQPSKLFAWKNKEGLLMAESIYWLNGNIGTQPPHLKSEAGEGWFVIVSDEALLLIQNLYPKLYIHKMLIRDKWDDSINKENMAIKSFLLS